MRRPTPARIGETRHVGTCRRIALWLTALCLVATIQLLAEIPREAAALVVDRPIVGMAATPDGGGYWEVASDGGIFTFGDAAFYGSEGGRPLNAPIVGLAATPDGGGYWEVASDGGIFAFGDATFYGSEGGQPLNAPGRRNRRLPPMVAATGRSPPTAASSRSVTPRSTAPRVADRSTRRSSGWRPRPMAAATGRSPPTAASSRSVTPASTAPRVVEPLNAPVVGVAATPDGGGYWEVASDGGIFGFGDATFWGSTGDLQLDKPVAGMAPIGGGYWEVASDGGIFSFGSARFHGSVPELPPPGPPRVALYGDSLVSESGQAFGLLAAESGATPRRPRLSWHCTLRLARHDGCRRAGLATHCRGAGFLR